MFLNCMKSSLSSGAPAEIEPCVPQAELELNGLRRLIDRIVGDLPAAILKGQGDRFHRLSLVGKDGVVLDHGNIAAAQIYGFEIAAGDRAQRAALLAGRRGPGIGLLLGLEGLGSLAPALGVIL